MTTSNIKYSFDSCRKVSKEKGCPPSIDDGLEIYALLKQATKGDIAKKKPAFYNVVERAKWDAWHKKRGLTQEEAMQKFVEIVRKAYSCSC